MGGMICDCSSLIHTLPTHEILVSKPVPFWARDKAARFQCHSGQSSPGGSALIVHHRHVLGVQQAIASV